MANDQNKNSNTAHNSLDSLVSDIVETERNWLENVKKTKIDNESNLRMTLCIMASILGGFVACIAISWLTKPLLSEESIRLGFGHFQRSIAYDSYSSVMGLAIFFATIVLMWWLGLRHDLRRKKLDFEERKERTLMHKFILQLCCQARIPTQNATNKRQNAVSVFMSKVYQCPHVSPPTIPSEASANSNSGNGVLTGTGPQRNETKSPDMPGEMSPEIDAEITSEVQSTYWCEQNDNSSPSADFSGPTNNYNNQ